MLTPASQRTARLLLTLGIIAGPLYVAAGLVHALMREGFDMRRHALSLLSNGEFGWVQIANFIVSGALVVAGALGCRLALRSQPAGVWGPMLLGLYGVGLIGAGIFHADPGNGFPPGVEAPESLTTSGLLHFVFGGLGFYAIITACFVFTRRFVRQSRKGLAWGSALTGAGFFVSFAAIASGSTAPSVLIAFYMAVAWVWAWHTIVLADVLRQSSAPLEAGSP